MHIKKQDKITHLGSNFGLSRLLCSSVIRSFVRACDRDLIGVHEHNLLFSGFYL